MNGTYWNRFKSALERFEALYEPEPNSGCWIWIGTVIPSGYGHFRLDGRSIGAHVASWLLYVGIITDETLDHLCRNRWCVNYAHLEPVARRVNVLRGIGPTAVNARAIMCPVGHQYDAGNTLFYADGRRYCKQCRASQLRAWREKNPETYAAQRQRSVVQIQAWRVAHPDEYSEKKSKQAAKQRLQRGSSR